jgi:hypothetical protein
MVKADIEIENYTKIMISQVVLEIGEDRKHQTYDPISKIPLKHNQCGLLVQRLYKESWKKLLHLHQRCVSTLCLFSLIYIYAWPVSFKFVFVPHELVSRR